MPPYITHCGKCGEHSVVLDEKFYLSCDHSWDRYGVLQAWCEICGQFTKRPNSNYDDITECDHPDTTETQSEEQSPETELK